MSEKMRKEGDEERREYPADAEPGAPTEQDVDMNMRPGRERRGVKRARSFGQSNDGAETNVEIRPRQGETPKKLGNLHQRRAEKSPQKFNTGQFESLPLQLDEQPVMEKPRIRNSLEIEYDATGTPRIASFSPRLLQPPSADGLKTSSLSSPSILTPFGLNISSANSPQTRQTRTTPQTRPFPLLAAFCRNNDLLLTLVSYLSIPSLESLYAISKLFHGLFNRHHTAFILACMRTWAPNCDRIFPWRCYKSLCAKDPVWRQKKRLEGRDWVAEGGKWAQDLRDVPSLRWLKMVVWRHGVCRDMLIQLALQGLRCPKGTLNELQKIWFLLDLPLNAHRIALIHNHEYITANTLHLWTHFLLKVDMHFTRPDEAPFPRNHPQQSVFPNSSAGALPSGVPLRKLLLSERHLTPLWRVLRGWTWDPSKPRDVPLDRLEILRLWIRHSYSPPEHAREEVRKMPVLGIPWYEQGTASLERVGVSFLNLLPSPSNAGSDSTKPKIIPVYDPAIAGTNLTAHQSAALLYPHHRKITFAHEKQREPLLRPDELLVREGVRRKMRMHTKWSEYMLWGFCDEVGTELPVLSEEDFAWTGKGGKGRIKIVELPRMWKLFELEKTLGWKQVWEGEEADEKGEYGDKQDGENGNHGGH